MQEVKDADAGEELYLSTSRAAVLADAEALLTCYGVGEESGAELLHAVVELCFTSSVRFLQPGLLLKVLHHTACVARLGKAHMNSTDQAVHVVFVSGSLVSSSRCTPIKPV